MNGVGKYNAKGRETGGLHNILAIRGQRYREARDNMPDEFKKYRSFDVGSIPWELNNIRRTYKKYFLRVHITLKQIKVTEPDSCNSNDKLLLLKILFMCSRLIIRMCCTLTF